MPTSSSSFMAAAAPDPPHQSLVATCRPWAEFLSLPSLSLPVSLSDATIRLSQNLTQFRVNYAVVSLLVLFLSLVYHPIVLVVFLLTLIAWFFFYFYRSTPIVVFNRTVDDRIVLVLLSLVTIFALVFAAVWFNVLVSAVISAFLICLHGVLMVTDFGGDPYGGLLSPAADDPSGVYGEF